MLHQTYKDLHMLDDTFEKSELSALKRKKTTLENRIERLRQEIKDLTYDIKALDRSIKLLTKDKPEREYAVYTFARGELKDLILKEVRIELDSFTAKLADCKKVIKGDEIKKLRASIYTTLTKLVKKGMIERLSSQEYINKCNDQSH